MQADPRYREIPVVVVSSDANQKHEAELKRFGVRAVLRKPFRPEQIRAIVRKLAKAEEPKEPKEPT
jgi:CheY-like chemotaxis protein